MGGICGEAPGVRNGIMAGDSSTMSSHSLMCDCFALKNRLGKLFRIEEVPGFDCLVEIRVFFFLEFIESTIFETLLLCRKLIVLFWDEFDGFLERCLDSEVLSLSELFGEESER